MAVRNNISESDLFRTEYVIWNKEINLYKLIKRLIELVFIFNNKSFHYMVRR